jgi:acyl carrier protein
MLDLPELLKTFEDGGVIVDVKTFDPDKSFFDNGIDSLDVMSLFLAVEEAFSIKLDEEQVERIHTPRELLNAVNQAQGNADF